MPVSEPIQQQIRSQFEPDEFEEVLRLLEQYGAEDEHREVDRIQSAILEQAGSSVDELKIMVAAALTDYRDVLYWLTFDENGNPPPLPKWNTDNTAKTPLDLSAELRDRDIILAVSESPGYKARQVAVNPTREEIARHLHALAWHEITFVVARIDDNHWLEGSGSLKPEDGLSAKCRIGDVTLVSQTAPGSLDEIVELIDSFVQRDGKWRRMIEWC